ncbi:hypothetical protein [Nocardia carnea]|uniref:hypothetical protein n=1 Tax=Nocardia carnea TaxID=37328 RepID=UPI0024587BCD|nr:hypothetical protein [Nocardia carnea]
MSTRYREGVDAHLTAAIGAETGSDGPTMPNRITVIRRPAGSGTGVGALCQDAGVGDFFERLVDLEVAAADASELAEHMIDWMVSRRWLLRETSRDAMYSLQVDEGYLPGPDWPQITEDWGADWIPAPVAVVVGRHDHYAGQGGIAPASAVCPRCGATTVIIDYPREWDADPVVWQPFSDAIDAWKQTGTGAATCASCSASSSITTWQWDDGFALGALAFDFWGWPPLTENFITEFATRLGHRIEHHTGKF